MKENHEIQQDLLFLKEITDSASTDPGFTGEVLRRIRRPGGGQADIRGSVLRLIRSVADRSRGIDRPGDLSREDLSEIARDHGLDLRDPAVVREILSVSRGSVASEELSARELKAVAGGRNGRAPLDRAVEALHRLLANPPPGE